MRSPSAPSIEHDLVLVGGGHAHIQVLKRWAMAPVPGVDPTARRLILDGRPPITYDTVSFDVGSTVAGLEVPGAREHAIPTRPIGEFVRRVDPILIAARERSTFRMIVVGA